MQNILIGNTKINGNLEVEGTQTTLNTETLNIKDGIIGVNSPAVVGRDSGLLIERAEDYSGNFVQIDSTSASIDQIAEPGWIIKIGSESREILTVSSYIITFTIWSPLSNLYKLYKSNSAGFFYKPSTEKFYAGHTNQTSIDNILNITPGILVTSRLEQLYGEQIWYVGKHGHDSLSGRTISEAKLTFSSIPAGATIVCLDSGIYNETINITGAVYAPQATINYLQISGEISVGHFVTAALSGNSILKFISGESITVSGQSQVFGEILTGITGIICSGEINGHINDFDCLTSFSISAGARVNLIGNISRSPTLASGAGTLYFAASKIENFTTTGSGNFYAIDSQIVSSHIASNSNPHNVTFDQLSPLTQKGDLVTHNGTNNIILPVGSVGQILRVKSDLNLEWTTPISGKTSFMIHPELTLVNSNIFTIISYFTWKQSEFSGFGLGKLIFNVVSTINLKFTDNTTNFVSGTYSAGFHAISFISNPITDSIIYLQVQKNLSGGKIIGVSLIF
mgnify:FL=1